MLRTMVVCLALAGLAFTGALEAQPTEDRADCTRGRAPC